METPTPYDVTSKRVNCEKHGENCPSVQWEADSQVFRRVCFKCYAEKQTEGLKDYSILPF